MAKSAISPVETQYPRHAIHDEETGVYNAGGAPQKATHTFRQVPDAVADIGDPYVTQTMHALLRIARGNNTINASRQRIAEVAKISPRKVADCLAILAKHKWISVDHRHGEKGYAANSITFTTPGTTCTGVRHDVHNPTAQDAVPYGTTCTTNRYVTTDTYVDTYTPTPQPQTQPEEKDVTIEERFETFWNAYPRKRSKGDAFKAFKAAKVNDALLTKMLDAIKVQRGSQQWVKDGGQFIPYPATWIRAESWDDEIEVPGQPFQPVTDPVADAKAERERLQSGNWKDAYERRLYGMDDIARTRRINELTAVIEGAAA